MTKPAALILNLIRAFALSALSPFSLLPSTCFSVVVFSGQFIFHPVGDKDHAFNRQSQ
jgi:hypothetical protein